MEARIEEAAKKVIGAAIEVHRQLGPGYLESVYEEALGVELTLRGIPFARQVGFALDYKGHKIGEGRMDLLVDSCLVVELKAVEDRSHTHCPDDFLPKGDKAQTRLAHQLQRAGPESRH